jgi:hypothetical protein
LNASAIVEHLELARRDSASQGNFRGHILKVPYSEHNPKPPGENLLTTVKSSIEDSFGSLSGAANLC